MQVEIAIKVDDGGCRKEGVTGVNVVSDHALQGVDQPIAMLEFSHLGSYEWR